MQTLLLLWFFFGFTHSLLASPVVKGLFMSWMGKAYNAYRFFYNLLSIAFMVAIAWVMYTEEVVFLFAAPAWVSYVAIALMALGGVGMVVALAQFDMLSFMGLSQLGIGKFDVAANTTLYRTGLFAYVRHPLYFAMMIVVAGAFLWHPTPMFLASGIAIYLYIYVGAVFEERTLVMLYKEQYRDYQKQVKMLIPFVF